MARPLLFCAVMTALLAAARGQDFNLTNGGSPVWQGMFQARVGNDPLYVGQKCNQGYVFISYLPSGEPVADVGAALGHACTTDPATVQTVFEHSLIALNGSALGPASYKCALTKTTTAGFAYADSPEVGDAAAAAAACPGEGTTLTQLDVAERVPDATLADATAAGCSAAGGPAGSIGDATATVDVNAAYAALPLPRGAATGQGFYTDSSNGTRLSIGVHTRLGYQFVSWKADRGMRLITTTWSSHACIDGQPLSFQGIGERKYVYLNGTVQVGAVCETVRYDAASRTLYVLATTPPAACPPTTFADADATYVSNLFAEEEGLGGGPATPCAAAPPSGAARAGALVAAVAAAAAAALAAALA